MQNKPLILKIMLAALCAACSVLAQAAAPQKHDLDSDSDEILLHYLSIELNDMFRPGHARRNQLYSYNEMYNHVMYALDDDDDFSDEDQYITREELDDEMDEADTTLEDVVRGVLDELFASSPSAEPRMILASADLFAQNRKARVNIASAALRTPPRIQEIIRRR